MKVLIVEDEAKTAAYLKRGLEENGFVADLADNGEDHVLSRKRTVMTSNSIAAEAAKSTLF